MNCWIKDVSMIGKVDDYSVTAVYPYIYIVLNCGRV